MTQGVYNFPLNQELQFRNDDQQLPPCNIEAEDTILGAIILDPLAINRVCHRLKPEHFYVPSHQDIYRACLKLAKKGSSTDLLRLTSFLSDKGILSKVGGQNKLANLVDRTVSSVNIDELATLVMEKAARRQLIKFGNEIKKTANSQEFELEEIMALLADKSSQMITTPHYQTKEESQKCKHKRILQELKEIYTTIPDPSFRFFKLKELAQYYGYGTQFLEQLYLKSLTGECSKLLTYEELKELGGSEVREWLLNGLVPKASTILLSADGGKGKTKFVYRIAKYLNEGKDFGDFTATGKRKILYYQGDESPGDMVQALETMGYSNPEINQNVKIRFGWSCENMPTLIQDIQEFQPDFVMIDSLSTANKFSVYKESDMEYARPLLEMAGLAATSGCTFLIIHHTNKDGGVRGSTAIRNAVSEVWHLDSDNSNQALPNDRILKIDKSRSRSSGKKYKLFFDDEHLDFIYLGEDGEDKSTTSTRKEIRDFLRSNRNTRFTAKEMAHILNRSEETVRRVAGTMGSDGIITKIANPGKANLYYLEVGCIQKTSHPVSHPEKTNSSPDGARDTVNVLNITIPPTIPPLDHPQKYCDTRDTEKGGIEEPNFEVDQTFLAEKISNCEKPSHHPTSVGNPDDTVVEAVGSGGGIVGGHRWDLGSDLDVIENEPLHSVTDSVTAIAPKQPQTHPSFSKNKTNRLKVRGITGQWKVKYEFGQETIHITFTTPQEKEVSVDDFCPWNWRFELSDLKANVKSGIYDLEMRELLKDKTFDVQRPKYDEEEGFVPVTVPGCKLVGVPNPCGGPFVFEMPTGDRFPVHSIDEFEIYDPMALKTGDKVRSTDGNKTGIVVDGELPKMYEGEDRLTVKWDDGITTHPRTSYLVKTKV